MERAGEAVTGVRVLAPARLHLGFLDLDGGLGRRFGSLGLAIEGIATTLRLRPADEPAAEGPEAERAVALLRTLAERWGVSPARVTVETAIPAHAGLGSGTQLGLGIGAGLARLHGLGVEMPAIGAVLERGARSGIGIGAFQAGGFLVDGGKGPEGAPPPIVARLPFPDRWRLLLVFDRGRQGLSGSAERRAFRTLPPFPPERAGHLCRLTLMRLLPGIATGDLDATGRALGEIQAVVGDHFAPAQGGRFQSALVADVLDWLRAEGLEGLGQSSWGPTGFALVGDPSEALRLKQAAEARFAVDWPTLMFRIVRARNRGGEVTVDA